MGPAAVGTVPGLIERLTDQDVGVSTIAAKSLDRIDPDWPRSDAAKRAVPALVGRLADPSPVARAEAERALARIDPDWPRSAGARQAIPALVVRLTDSSPEVRAAAGRVLGRIDRVLGRIHSDWPHSAGARQAIPALVDRLSDSSPEVRAAAERVLEGIGPNWPRSDAAKQAIPALVVRLTDSSPGVRAAAEAALGQIEPHWPHGAGARQAVPGLVELLATPDHSCGYDRYSGALRSVARQPPGLSVGGGAAKVLGRIDPNWPRSDAAKRAVPRIISLTNYNYNLNNCSCGTITAIRSLGRLGPSASGSVPRLIETLKSSDPRTRSEAAEALGRIGSAAAGAVPKLVEIKGDPDPHVRSSAALAIQCIRGSEFVGSIEGDFVPSGWMGDAQTPNGPLSYRISREDPASPPTCEEWTYDPARGVQGWAAVAYQFPAQNWGDRPGKNLRGHGITRLCFRARAHSGQPVLVVRAGGHTKPDAAQRASFETEEIVIDLRAEWTNYEIPIYGNLSNVITALAFTVRRADCDGRVTFCIDDIAFRGPGH